MKRNALVLALFLAAASMVSAAGKDDKVMKKENGVYIVNTSTLSDKQGYIDKTPLEIHIKSNKIVKVVALKNQETPKYFAMIKGKLLPIWVGMKVSKALSTDVDAVTGATYSSEAVKDNVKKGLQYYQKNKRK